MSTVLIVLVAFLFALFYLASEGAEQHSREREQKQIVIMVPQPNGYLEEQFRERDVGRNLALAGLLFLLFILGGAGLLLWFVVDILAQIFT